MTMAPPSPEMFPPRVLDEAAKAAFPADVPQDPTLARLRELRAEIQDLRSVLTSIRSGEIGLQTYAPYIRKTLSDATKLMKGLEYPGYEDVIRHLTNLWELAGTNPLLKDPSAAGVTPEDQLRHLTMLDGICKKMVFQIAYLTIPPRINDWLNQTRPGYCLPFHTLFEDELPDREDRQTLLHHLAASPESLPLGLVDPETGLIYRFAQSRRQRMASLGFLAGAFAAGVGIVLGAGFLPLEGWPLSTVAPATLLIGWAAVLAGVGVHVAIGAAKRMRSEAGHGAAMVLGDLPLIVNARMGQILLKLVLTLIGYFGLVFSAGVQNANPFNAFLVGYALDSVVELFGAGLEQKAGSQATALKKRLGF